MVESLMAEVELELIWRSHSRFPPEVAAEEWEEVEDGYRY
jgi:hypothetical protein